MPVNDAPELSLSGGVVDFGGTPIILDPAVTVSDTELDALNGGAGDYAGATVTVARDTGANSDDVFTFADGNGITRLNNALVKNGQIIASFNPNAIPGQLLIGFVGGPSETVTTADVDNILGQIQYENANVTSPESIQINVTLNDGNSSAQGSGGSEIATGSVNVGILSEAPAPVVLNVDENSTNGTSIGVLTPDLSQAAAALTASDPMLVYNEVTGKFYQLVTNTQSFTNALNDATSTGLNGVDGQLLTIRSAYENALAVQIAGGDNVWLGARDSGVEGEWRWLDGTADDDLFWSQAAGGNTVTGSFASWDPAEPNNSTTPLASGEDVAALNDEGEWYDWSDVGNHQLGYIIEWDASEVLANVDFDLTDDAAGRFAIDNSGQITVANSSTLDHEANASHVVTAEYTFNGGVSYTEDITIDVNDLNESPTVVAPGGTVDEGLSVTLNSSILQATDEDVTDGPGDLTYSVTGSLNGTLRLGSATGPVVTSFTQADLDAGNLVFVHDGSQTTTAGFDFTVEDGGEDGASSTSGTLNLLVNNVNDDPDAVDDAFSTDEDTDFIATLGVNDLLQNDLDVDGDTLMVTTTPVSGPGNGQVAISLDGTFTYTPDPDFFGTDSFTYEVTDGNGGRAEATVDITVNPVNDAPVFLDHGFSAIDGTFGGQTDPDFVGRGSHFSDQSFIVDTSQIYELSAFAFATDVNGGPTAANVTQFLGFASYDVDGNLIRTDQVTRHLGSVDTTLAFDLNPGDTQIVLNDATGWYDGNDPRREHARSLAWYGYQDSTGQTYADYTYTRNVESNLWDAGAISGNVITLREAWSGPALSAGDAVRNATSGSTFNYSLLQSEQVPTTLTEYSATFGGGESTGEISADLFRPGTHSIRLNVISNHTPVDVPTDTDSIFHIEHFELNTTVGAFADGFTTYVEGDAPIALVDTDARIEDVDDVFIESVTIELTNGMVGDILHVDEAALSAIGISVTGVPNTPLTADGSILLTLTADTTESVTRLDFTQSLVNVTFENVSESPSDVNRVVNFVANDGETDSAIRPLVIRVVPVNDDPVANNDMFTTNEDSPLINGNLLLNDTDIDGDTLMVNVTPIVDPVNGTVTLNANGTFTYTPNSNFNGTDSFTYEVTDGNGGTEEATVDITVNSINDGPVAVDDSFTVDEDGALTASFADLLLNDTDVEGDSLNLGNVFTPANGTLTFGPNGTFTYTPDADFNGTDSFTYSINDGNGGMATATVDIVVNSINDAPTTGPVTLNSIVEDSGVRVISQAELLGSASDVDSNNLTATGLTITAGNGSLVQNSDGSWSFTPLFNDDTEVSFSYTITDGTNNVAATATLDITPVNDPIAVVNNTGSSVTEGGTDTIETSELLFADVELPASSLTYSVTQAPQNGFVALASNPSVSIGSFTQQQIDNGEVIFVHNGSEATSDGFEFSVTDGLGDTVANQTFAFNVTPVNDTPIVTGGTFSVDENSQVGTVVGTVAFSDADLNDTVSLAITAGDPTGIFAINSAGEILVADSSQLDFESVNSFALTVVATDNGTPMLSDSAIVQININDVNEIPVEQVNTGATVNEGEAHVISTSELEYIDTELVSAVFEISQAPAHGTLTLNGVPVGVGSTFSQTDIDSGSLVYAHDGSENFADGFTFNVTDGFNVVTGQIFDLAIDPANDAPVAVGENFVVDEDNLLSSINELLLNDTDVDSQLLTVSLVTGPVNSSSFELLPDGSFTYQPAANFNGIDQFVYRVSDDAGASATAVVSITVNPVNDIPSAVADEYQVIFGQTLESDVSVLNNDSDVENALVAVLIDDATNGTLSLTAQGDFVYVPNPGFIGTDTFSYVANDGTSNGAVTTVNVEVLGAPIPSPPNPVTQNDSTDSDTTEPSSDNPTDQSDSTDEPSDNERPVEGNPGVNGTPIPVAGLPQKLDPIVDLTDERFQTVLGLVNSDDSTVGEDQAREVLRLILNNVSPDEINSSRNEEQLKRLRTAGGIAKVFDANYLFNELDDLARPSQLLDDFNITVGAVTAFGSLGYVLWTLRGGALLAVALSQLPTWNMIDPLPVLESYSMKKEDVDEGNVGDFFNY